MERTSLGFRILAYPRLDFVTGSRQACIKVSRVFLTSASRWEAVLENGTRDVCQCQVAVLETISPSSPVDVMAACVISDYREDNEICGG